MPFFLSSYLLLYSMLSSFAQITWNNLFPQHLTPSIFTLWLRLRHSSGMFTYHFYPHIKMLSILESSSQIVSFQYPYSMWLLSCLHLHSNVFLPYAIYIPYDLGHKFYLSLKLWILHSQRGQIILLNFIFSFFPIHNKCSRTNILSSSTCFPNSIWYFSGI